MWRQQACAAGATAATARCHDTVECAAIDMRTPRVGDTSASAAAAAGTSAPRSVIASSQAMPSPPSPITLRERAAAVKRTTPATFERPKRKAARVALGAYADEDEDGGAGESNSTSDASVAEAGDESDDASDNWSDDGSKLRIAKRRRATAVRRTGTAAAGASARPRGSGGGGVGFEEEKSGVLMSWMLEHVDWPYPTKEEKVSLCRRADITPTQLRNWFTNLRKRHWKPIRQGRAPRTVIDEVVKVAPSVLRGKSTKT